MKKGVILKILLFLSSGAVLVSFYIINESNYLQQKKIEIVNVEHPENLPTSDSAKFRSFGFMNINADMFWLKSIQYIGNNVIDEDYKKYLGAMMNLITDLNPYFESPYIIGQLLLPGDKYAREDQDPELNKRNLKLASELGLKGVSNFCDIAKIDVILKEEDLSKILNEEKYRNPCKSYKIPYYLAFIYYFHIADNTKAAGYYKVVSAQDDAPSGAKVLAAIMEGKGGEREKSLYMFLSLAESTGSQDEVCLFMKNELENAYTGIKNGNLVLNGDLVRSIENLSNQVLPRLTEENENEILDDTRCTNYLAKAVREINLMYIESADTQYILDNPNEGSAKTPEKLFELGYIDFIPTDYQQYQDEGYGIVYRYNDEIQNFDYEMDYTNYSQ